MHLPGIGPRGEAGCNVELAKEPAHDFIGVGLRAQSIELGHDLQQGVFHVANRVLRIMLTLLIETALTLDELFAVEVGDGTEDGLWQPRIREVT